MTATVTIGIVVPTRNSARTLEACLRSIRAQTRSCRTVVVDNHSADATQRIAQEWADEIIVQGPERSAQRNAGAAALGTDVVGFVDSDMTLEASVVEEVAGVIAVSGHGALIIPERSVGEGFWSAVRAYERAFYVGQDSVEAPRFFLCSVFEEVGGFDVSLDAGEDWDLGQRVRAVTGVGRIAAYIDHDEGRLTYRRACVKKAGYAVGLRSYTNRHGAAGLLHALDRPYLRRPWRLTPHPLLGAGVVALKAGETAAVMYRLATGQRLGAWQSRGDPEKEA